jgi:hypothetical protein
MTTYPKLQTFFCAEVPIAGAPAVGDWIGLPQAVQDDLLEQLRRNPSAPAFTVPFRRNGVDLEFRCFRDRPSWNRVMNTATQDEHPTVCLTHFWSYFADGVFKHYGVHMACQLEYAYLESLMHPELSYTVCLDNKYDVHLAAEGHPMVQVRISGGKEREVLRTAIPVGPPPTIIHYKDGRLARAGPPPLYYRDTQAMLEDVDDVDERPLQPRSNAPSHVPDGIVIGFVKEATICSNGDKVTTASYSLVDAQGAPLGTVELRGERCVNFKTAGVRKVLIAAEQLIYEHVAGLAGVMSGMSTVRRLMNYLSEHFNELTTIGLIEAAWVIFPLGLIVLMGVFTWLWCRPLEADAAAVLGVWFAWAKKTCTVRDATLATVDKLCSGAVNNVNAGKVHRLLSALYVFETVRDVLPCSLMPSLLRL